MAARSNDVRGCVVSQQDVGTLAQKNGLTMPQPVFVVIDLTPNYVPALMRGSRVKGPLLFWSEGVARTGALGMVK